MDRGHTGALASTVQRASWPRTHYGCCWQQHPMTKVYHLAHPAERWEQYPFPQEALCLRVRTNHAQRSTNRSGGGARGPHGSKINGTWRPPCLACGRARRSLFPGTGGACVSTCSNELVMLCLVKMWECSDAKLQQKIKSSPKRLPNESTKYMNTTDKSHLSTPKWRQEKPIFIRQRSDGVSGWGVTA